MPGPKSCTQAVTDWVSEAKFDQNRLRFGRILDGIGQEICQNLADAFPVSPNRCTRLGPLSQWYVALSSVGGPPLLLPPIHQRRTHSRVVGAFPFHAIDIQQIINETGQSIDLLIHSVPPDACPAYLCSFTPSANQLRIALQTTQRRFEFVNDHTGELVSSCIPLVPNNLLAH